MRHKRERGRELVVLTETDNFSFSSSHYQ